MNKLNGTLKKMGRVQFRLFTSAHSSRHDASAKLVGHRQDFNEVCGEFLVQLQEFLRETGDTETFLSLQSAFDEMRSAHLQHQVHWTPQAIAADHALYLQRSQRIGLLIRNFIDDAIVATELRTAADIEAVIHGKAA